MHRKRFTPNGDSAKERKKTALHEVHREKNRERMEKVGIVRTIEEAGVVINRE